MPVDAYDLSLAFDPPARRFEGTVGIDLISEGGPVVLNAADLAIRSATVDGTAVTPEVDGARQEIRFPPVAAGRHRLDVAFSGKVLPNGLAGAYISPFGAAGEILTTQMYPAGARRCFPCIDLPAAKSVLNVRLGVPEGARVIFNTDPIAETVEDGHRWIRFAPTPKMSTYLLYIGIGPFEETARVDGDLRVIVAHPPGRSGAAAFALENAAAFVRAYEAYYQIPYPLPKLHLVAVPSFWAGAMENWGAIAFREQTLLVTERTDALQRRWNRLVLAHEIAHQWFGNLVTNAWWNDFWLNEAFATFVSHRIVDRVHPGESTWADFVAREMNRGLAQDSLRTTHPIEVEIRAPEEIGEIADGITYGKGASVLRMIEAYLGEEAFRRGVTAYLNDHRYGAARGADLWAALDAHSEVPVSRIMQAWVTRPGHPLVEARREGNELVVTPRRFHGDGTREPSDWPIPLVVEVDGAEHRTVLEHGSFRCPIGPASHLRINPDRTGFYRVRYDGELGPRHRADWDRLSEIDQWGLLVDTRAFLASGDAPLSEYLELVERAAASDRYLPSITAARELRGLERFRDDVPALQEAHRRFFAAQFERLGDRRRPGEPEAFGVLRGTVAWGMLRADPSVRHALAHAFRAAEASIDADLLDVATAAYALEGGEPAWEDLRARLDRKPPDDEAFRIATSLPFAPGAAELRRTLELLEGPTLSASRIWDVLRAANAVPGHSDALWTWYQEKLPALAERWKGSPLLSLLLPESLPSIGLGRSDDVRSYFEAHRFPGAERGVAEGIERLRLRELLAERIGVRLTATR